MIDGPGPSASDLQARSTTITARDSDNGRAC